MTDYKKTVEINTDFLVRKHFWKRKKHFLLVD